jgi:hypothetical protein
MGFEIIAPIPQVAEKTHRHPSIWAHLGAEFCVWPQHFAYAFDCFPLCVSDHVSVSL